MKSLKYIFFLILIAIIGGSIYIATLNSNFDISQTRTMKVPVSLAYKNVNDFKNWKNWGPWFESDPTIVASFPEKSSGVGASYSWTGAEGNGSIKTISVIENKEIIQQIDFSTGSTPEVYWNFNKVSDSIQVTWGMRGKSTFGEKIYWLMNGGIEKNMIPMYQRGLELLEQELIKEMDKHSTTYIGEVDHGGGFYLYQTVTSRPNTVTQKMEEIFNNISTYMSKNTIQASGNPFTLNHKIDLENGSVLFSSCVPVRERVITEGDIFTGYLPPQKTFKTIFKGHYKYLSELWPRIYSELKMQGFTPVEKGYSFEIYSISPKDSENPADWTTEIYVPIE